MIDACFSGYMAWAFIKTACLSDVSDWSNVGNACRRHFLHYVSDWLRIDSVCRQMYVVEAIPQQDLGIHQ